MQFLKRLAKSEAVRAMAPKIGSYYLRLVFLTGKWEICGPDSAYALWDSDDPIIVCFWHGRMVMSDRFLQHFNQRKTANDEKNSTGPRRRQATILSSQHRDGRLVSQLAACFGIGAVEGSTGRGGASALRKVVRILRRGGCVLIAPDGPTGPARQASAGMVVAARLAGAKILPISFGVAKGRHMKSWDRFLVPGLFSKGVIAWGEPIAPPTRAGEADLQAVLRAVEDSLNDLDAQCDRRCGHTGPIDRESAGS